MQYIVVKNAKNLHFLTKMGNFYNYRVKISRIGAKKTPEKVSSCVPREARTLDPLIKSQLLYQLS